MMNESNKILLAMTSLFVGVIALSVSPILIIWSENEISPNAIAFNRFWIASVVFGLWQGGKAIRQQLSFDKPVQQQRYTRKELLLMLGAGTFFAATLVFMAWSLTQTSVAISIVLHNLTPIFTSLGAWLLFGQGFNRQFLIGMVIAIGGAIAIELDELQIATSNVQGGIAAILSAIFMAAYLLIVEQLRIKFSAPTLQLWICGSAALVIFPVLLFAGDQIFPSSVGVWLAVIAWALICQVLGQGLLIYSLDRLSSVVVSLVHLLQPVFSAIFAWAIFWENLSFSKWVAFAVVLIGLYLAVSSQAAVHFSLNSLEDS